ncbi:hypothetical protein [Phocaeicola vulgatus]|uniref:hypothetical protein n=1 Tax=Phocaeicola vulgatus TaxID=821 RepID=UPI000E448B3C|nr:hypothetical protein [Phocaeicola vulgatus]
MGIVIFDVGNASCNYICSPNKYAMMIDCGSSNEKPNPVDIIKNFNAGNCEPFKSKPFVTSLGKAYPLALLHITHPDDDHVRNSERIYNELTPYLLQRIYTEQYDDSDSINKDYVENLDKGYRGNNPERIDWGFENNITFHIPIETVKSDSQLRSKIRNNSSIIRYIKYNNVKFLFAGDLETAGWEWLAEHDSRFSSLMKNGLDVLVAPHHGHDSGFPKALFDLTGNVKTIILSKDSEATKEGTDVFTGYSNYAEGINYYNFSDKNTYFGKVLTTRSNGNIYILVDNSCGLSIYADKASSNHKKL